MADRTEFQIVPDHSDIAALKRDLCFFPCENRDPSVLTVDQIASFNQNGFLSGIRIFSELEVAAHRRYFDELLAQAFARGEDSYSISTAHLKHRKVYDLLTEPRLVAIVCDLLGNDVIGWGSHFFCKMPHDGKIVSWHQDASYWPLTPSKTVTIWLAIDDADRENACMQFIPGSHLQGHLAYRMSEGGEGNVLDQTVEMINAMNEPEYIELRAGEISVHTDLLLHGSEANDSDRRRCGLTLRYCTPDVVAHMGWNEKGVVVHGTDPFGHWANRARPKTD